MSVPFSEDLWQRLSALWRRDKKEVEEAVGYDDPQLKQMLDVMMVSRRSMKAAEKQKYDICLLYTSPSPRDVEESRMPSSA